MRTFRIRSRMGVTAAVIRPHPGGVTMQAAPGEMRPSAAAAPKASAMVCPFVLAAALLAGSAAAAEGHEWYSGLRIPSGPLAGKSCCSGQDCRKTEYCVLPGGKQGIVSRFGCVAIPWSKVLGIVSPDGAPHLCDAPLTTVFVPYCVVLGGDV